MLFCTKTQRRKGLRTCGCHRDKKMIECAYIMTASKAVRRLLKMMEKRQVTMLGGRWMDMFMDKLAQKLTAQEMIKANSAAEVEEVNRLKAQIEEYDKCLENLKGLIAEGVVSLEQARVDGGEIDRLVQESIEKIRQIQQNSQIGEELKTHFNEKMENSNEYVHKECVKVYRNVQAVVVEESGKQSQAAQAMEVQLSKIQGKLGAVLGVSVAALIFALGGVTIQVLTMLNLI